MCPFIIESGLSISLSLSWQKAALMIDFDPHIYVCSVSRIFVNVEYKHVTCNCIAVVTVLVCRCWVSVCGLAEKPIGGTWTGSFRSRCIIYALALGHIPRAWTSTRVTWFTQITLMLQLHHWRRVLVLLYVNSWIICFFNN